MLTIWDKVATTPSERPKYTRYELGEMVREKRIKLNLSIVEVAENFQVEESLWESIENASRSFNVRIYKLIQDFLEMPKEELLAKDVDDFSLLSFRKNKENHDEIQEAFEIANKIFDEMVIQKKIGVH